MKYTLHIRRGRLINDDPQRRCYNGCFFKSHIEWSDWELWIKDYFFTTKEAAQHAANQFKRENQEFKVVGVEEC